MGPITSLVLAEVKRRLAKQSKTAHLLWIVPLLPALLIALSILVVGLFVIVESGALNSGGCGGGSLPSAPSTDPKTLAAFVHYFESQGISANGAAGITGNLEQEHNFAPNTDSGGVGIAQWDPITRGPAMQSWDKQHSLDPSTVIGQVTYLVYDLRNSYPQLLAELNSAPDPGTAAEMFETTYEDCSGVLGYMNVAPGSACNDTARRQYAASALQAAGSTLGTVLVDYTPGGTCIASGGLQRLLQLAIAVEGTPYSTGGHATVFNYTATELRASATDCSGFVSWLMGPQGLNIWRQPLATPAIPTAPSLVAGQGQYVTIWNNPLPEQAGHVWISILGHYFEEGGKQRNEHEMTASEAQYYWASGQFVPFHPAGM